MTRRLTIDDLTSITVPFAPALAPDGRRIAYVVRTPDVEKDRPTTALWLAEDGAEPRQLTQGDSDAAPAWSPDGTQIAFLRPVDGAPQVFLMNVGGGEARGLTSLALGAGAPAWSPDGAHIAFTAPVDAASGAKDAAPIVVNRPDYQADGLGDFGTMRTQLHVLDVAAGTVRQLTYGDELVDAPAWSPDGTTIAFTSGAEGGGRPLVRPVWTIEAHNTKANPRVVALRDGYAQALLWTADAASLIVVGHAGAPKGHTRLLRVSLTSDEVTDLAAPLDRNVMAGAPAYPGATPALIDDGARVLFCVRDRGVSHLYAVDVAGGDPTPVLTGEGRLVAGMSVAAGIAALVLITRESFGEIVTIDLASGAETVRTHHGDGLADVQRYPHTERTFTISDGVEVHGWVISDPEQEGPRPLLVDIHGGPHNAWNDTADEMHLYHQELIARGWAVVILNPRGSDGYGEAFFTGVDGAWGISDAKDFLEPVDALVAEGLADRKRLAVAGYSYGGYMTCYLTGHDDRFAAAVTGGVVADLVSMVGTDDVGALIGDIELGGYPWTEPERFAVMSPYTAIGQVSTPTLVLQGDADRRCPVGQAQQWYGALQQRGIPSEMVLYPGASHLFPVTGRLSHRLDYNRRVLAWLERFAGDAVGPRPAAIDAAHWQSRLAVLAERHGIVGAQLGILRLGSGPDEMVRAAHGTLNKLTGAPVTVDSIFQIGSISKVWTATLAMQLIDEGKFALDTPVIELVPELRLKDAEAQAGVTIWHLLTHTSGIDGDIFTDTGRGDDAVGKLVALLSDAMQNHPLGASWSYCNAGYALLGYVIQKVTGDTWEEAIHKRLAVPLGLTRTVTLPQDAIRYSVATGHVPGPDGESVPTPVWDLPRSIGPAGLITQSTDELLAFARMHMTGGLAGDGTRLLSEASAAAMAEFQVDLPDKNILGDSWGLGWIRFDYNGHRVIGHDGSTLGQNGFLRILPEQGLAVTILVNGGHSGDYFRELAGEIFAEVAGVDQPEAFAPPVDPIEVDASEFLGVYERASVRMEVLRDDAGVLTLTTQVTGTLAELSDDKPEQFELVAVSDSIFAMQAPDTVGWMPVTFFTLDNGQPYMHFGVRATPRVS